MAGLSLPSTAQPEVVKPAGSPTAPHRLRPRVRGIERLAELARLLARDVHDPSDDELIRAARVTGEVTELGPERTGRLLTELYGGEQTVAVPTDPGARSSLRAEPGSGVVAVRAR